MISASQIALPEKIKDELVLLDGRRRRLKRYALIGLIAALGLTACAVIAMLRAKWALPAETLASIHVPPELAKLTQSTGGGGGISGAANFNEAFTSFSSILDSAVFKIFAILSILIGVALCVITEKISLLPGFVILPSSLMFFPSVINTINPKIETPTAISIQDLAKNADTEGIKKILVGTSAANLVEHYLVAQSQLIHLQKGNLPTEMREELQAHTQAISSALAKTPLALPLTVSAEVIYILERSVQGAVSSNLAIEYEQIARSKSEGAWQVAKVAGVGAGWLLLLTAGVGGMALLISRRQQTIQRLMAIPKAQPASPANPAPAKQTALPADHMRPAFDRDWSHTRSQAVEPAPQQGLDLTSMLIGGALFSSSGCHHETAHSRHVAEDPKVEYEPIEESSSGCEFGSSGDDE